MSPPDRAPPETVPPPDRTGGALRSRRLWLLLAALVLGAILAIALRVPILAGLGRLTLWAVGLSLAGWLITIGVRRLLWRVGRRLLLSYLLIGVVPVPMALAIGAVGAYLCAGFFLTHLVRATFADAGLEVAITASDAARSFPDRATWTPPFAGTAVAFYRDGVKVSGDERAPKSWPTWLEEETKTQAETRTVDSVPVVGVLSDGAQTVVAATRVGTAGALAFLDGDLETNLRERSGVWVELFTGDDQETGGGAAVSIGDNRWVLQPLERTLIGRDIAEFFGQEDVPRILVRGLDSYGTGRDLETGEPADDRLSATLFAPPGVVADRLLTSAAEVDTVAWLAFIVPAFLLFDVYVAAAVVAAVMIVGLTRAVNSLSSATAKVQGGDFSVRIPVRRKDQLGALQESFNGMAANLEELVAQAAEQELLHKELQIAQDLQRSLLPDAGLIASESVEIATFFEPSAAIGGDYFDLFPLDEERGRLVVFVADVAGHGIAAGLRMAMLKAALDTLVREGTPPERILESLDGLVRAGRADTRFVTATLALVDLRTGRVELTNAGHPPTYRLARDGKVDEFMLPSPPLGTFGRRYGRAVVQIEPGDVLVWVSDGFIEACDDADESFGYDRVMTALGGSCTNAILVRDRVLDAVRGHTAGRELSDDRTLVALRYLGPPAAAIAIESEQLAVASS